MAYYRCSGGSALPTKKHAGRNVNAFDSVIGKYYIVVMSYIQENYGSITSGATVIERATAVSDKIGVDCGNITFLIVKATANRVTTSGGWNCMVAYEL